MVPITAACPDARSGEGFPLGEVRVRSGGEDGPVRVVAGSGRWLRAASNGVEPRFARAVRAMAGAEGSDAVC